MTDTANNVIDARLQEALGQYFNGVTLVRTVGDCALLSGIRKQNGAPVDIYAPSLAAAREDATVTSLAKQFETYEKMASPRLQSPERLLNSRAFRKSPALAVLACPVPVFDEAFDTRPVGVRLRVFDEILEGLAALHGAGLIHGNLSPDAVRREDAGGALRLGALTFSAERTTNITAQPPAYQSRHVINASQPRLVDDIHAAGMIGYRILLGPHGPERLLTGRAEAEESRQIVGAILGEDLPAPTGAALFPEGHPGADQLARLLARMIGRLPNAAPYSNADAARRAFRSIIDNSGAGIEAADPVPVLAAQGAGAMHVGAPAAAAAGGAASGAAGGISRGTALAIFAGFVAATAGAVYFYLQADGLRGDLDRAVTRGRQIAGELADATVRIEGLNGELTEAAAGLETARGRIEGLQSDLVATRQAGAAIRAAAEQVTIARLAGAQTASAEAAAAYVAASDALDVADAGLEAGDAAAAGAAATAALDQATLALDRAESARAAAETALATATASRGAAAAAGAAEGAGFAEGAALLDTAAADFGAAAFDAAASGHNAAAAAFAAALDELRIRATEARRAAASAKSEAEAQIGTAGYLLGESLERRAIAAFDAGQLADAIEAFAAAREAFETATSAPQATTRPQPAEVVIGDDAAALAAAVALCLDAAPIPASACPLARAPGEAARSASLTPYALDRTEVSTAEFAAFVAATGFVTDAERGARVIALTGSGEARFIDGGYTWSQPDGNNTTWQAAPDLPVRNISMNDAAAYCQWADGRLPTEAEWEHAAREGTARAFPFGDWDPTALAWRGAPDPAQRLPLAVAQAGATTGAGLVGLAGNVREWVQSEDGAVLKGGSWNSANPADLRISARVAVPQNAPGVDFGLRCAQDLEAWQ